MEREKLQKRNLIILIAVTLLLLIALIVGWWFALVKPVANQRTAAQNQYDARKAIADRLEKAQIDQRKAEDRLIEVNGQVQFFRQFYRSLEFGDIGDPASLDGLQRAERERTWRAWLREYFGDYSQTLSNTLQTKAAQSGVALEGATDIKVANPPQTPEEVAPPPNGFLKPTQGSGNAQGGAGTPGGFTPVATTGSSGGFPGGGGGGATAPAGAVTLKATGSLPQLIDFFQRLNNSPILMVVQSFKLESSLGATGNNGPGLGTTGLTAPGAFPGGSAFPGAAQQRQTPNGIPKVTATFDIVPYLLARGAGAPITSGGGGGAAAPASPPAGIPGAGFPGARPAGGGANSATP